MPRLVAFALITASFAVDAHACRCKQQTLADYYNAADYVAIATLRSVSDDDSHRVMTFEFSAAPHKSEIAGDTSTVSLVTTTSSASCGVPVDVNAIYVLFGHTDPAAPSRLRVDTCSGTRVHISAQQSEPQGFDDVPARFVAQQLNALAGLDELRAVQRNAPDPTSPANATLIGLLDLKALAHGGFTRLYSQPDSSSDFVANIHDWDAVEHREIGYEVNAAVVFQAMDGWYRLRSADGQFGWVSAVEAGTWFPYDQLPVRKLAYLTGTWSGLVWPAAGAGIPTRLNVAGPQSQREHPINVLESTMIGGMPFFRIEVLEASVCDGGKETVRASGWVPAYDRGGQPSVWFYSRGC